MFFGLDLCVCVDRHSRSVRVRLMCNRIHGRIQSVKTRGLAFLGRMFSWSFLAGAISFKELHRCSAPTNEVNWRSKYNRLHDPSCVGRNLHHRHLLVAIRNCTLWYSVIVARFRFELTSEELRQLVSTTLIKNFHFLVSPSIWREWPPFAKRFKPVSKVSRMR